MSDQDDLTLPRLPHPQHVKTRRALTYPIAQLHAVERRRQKPREGRVLPQGHTASKWQARASTLDSHWGVCHWVGETGRYLAVCLCPQPVSSPTPATDTIFCPAPSGPFCLLG